MNWIFALAMLLGVLKEPTVSFVYPMPRFETAAFVSVSIGNASCGPADKAGVAHCSVAFKSDHLALLVADCHHWRCDWIPLIVDGKVVQP